MIDFFRHLFGSEFMPHGHCYLWRPEILWLHVGSDVLIAVAYFSIPVALLSFVRRREDLAFSSVFKLFSAFIFACGMTHLLSVWTTWHGTYRVEGVVKALTAGVSVLTAGLLWPMIPRALALPSPKQLGEANERLREQVRERERAEARLRELNDTLERRVLDRTSELERSNEELEAFAYLASHDLKEPLRGIHSYATFLAEDHADALDAEGKGKLETIERLARRMDALLENMLGYARLGRGEAFVATSLDGVVDEVLETLRPTLEQRSVEIRRPGPLPRVVCDPTRIGQVFANLIGNAVKYGDPTAPWIEIGSAERLPEGVAPDGPEAAGPWIYVRDNGIGIEPRHHQAIFQLFRRLHARDHYGGGFGVGLALVQKIVRLHGGEIRVESAPGAGTTFWLRLAADRTEQAAGRASGLPVGS